MPPEPVTVLLQRVWSLQLRESLFRYWPPGLPGSPPLVRAVRRRNRSVAVAVAVHRWASSEILFGRINQSDAVHSPVVARSIDHGNHVCKTQERISQLKSHLNYRLRISELSTVRYRLAELIDEIPLQPLLDTPTEERSREQCEI